MGAPDSQMLDNTALTFCCQRWLSLAVLSGMLGGTWQGFFTCSTVANSGMSSSSDPRSSCCNPREREHSSRSSGSFPLGCVMLPASLAAERHCGPADGSSPPQLVLPISCLIRALCTPT